MRIDHGRRVLASSLLAAMALSGAALWLAPGAAAGRAVTRYVPTKLIDFSPLHNVMIRSDDGTLTPMDVPHYRSKLIAPGTWQIESDGDYSYLIEGDKEALAIDTGYGAGNIRAYLRTLTRKPVRHVANTHFHFDHTANNSYFDRAYMSAGTAEKATTPFPSFAGIIFPRNYPKVIIGDGYVFHLGGRDIEALIISNHTLGGTAYLDRKARILFSGDEIMPRNEPINVSVAQFAANMRKLETHRREFDRVAGGPGIFDVTYVDRYLAAADSVLSGHEGERPQPRPPLGASPASTNPNAPIIYMRRMVRAPDRPANMGAVNDTTRVMAAGDLQITYDARHVRD